MRDAPGTTPIRPVVVADAGPLIGLARITQLALLPRLFGTVAVTSWVAQEVLAGGDFPDKIALQDAFDRGWLQTADMAGTTPELLQARCRDLINLHQIDMGEATALVLAQQLRAQGVMPLLLIDDHRGRQAARHSGITTIGTAGLLLLAKEAGAVNAVKPLLLELRENGYFLAERLIATVLEQTGE